ncbi:MAG: GerMN domain-containing protein [Clostridia bacterium]|nr:GerMN domain-containing protein [Clostridia bacterium]
MGPLHWSGKKIKLNLLFLGFILGLSIFLAAGCGGFSAKAKAPSKETDKPAVKSEVFPKMVTVYFATDDGYMVPVTYSVNKSSSGNVVKFAVEKLLLGPESKYLLRTIPEETKLRNWHINSHTVVVDFSKEFLKMDSRDQVVMAVNSLCLTLGNIPEIKDVQILVEGKVVEKIHGVNTDQPLEKQYINYSGEMNPEATYKVYFSDPYAMYMVPVTLAASANANLPRKAVEDLLHGPYTEGLGPTVMRGTRLLGLDVEDGTATVNLSGEALGYGGGSTAEIMFVKSLLLTLGQFPEVKRVQILIEGEKLDYLPEGTEIGKPIEPPKYANLYEESM